MYHTPDYKAKPFAAKNRVHYMYDDIQLSRSSTQTQLHEVTIDGVITKLHIRRSACEGVNYVREMSVKVTQYQTDRGSIDVISIKILHPLNRLGIVQYNSFMYGQPKMMEEDG